MGKLFFMPVLKKIILILFVLNVPVAFTISAQYKILLLNSNERVVSKYELRGTELVYKKPDDKKNKVHKIDRYGVFSVTDSTGKEEIIYSPFDTIQDLSPERMRVFIKGEKFAAENYRVPFGIKAESFIVSAGAGLLNIYGTPVPFANAAVVQMFPPDMPRGLQSPPAETDNKDFIEGYKYKAKKRKIEQSLLWGGIGFTIGFTAFAIIIPNTMK